MPALVPALLTGGGALLLCLAGVWSSAAIEGALLGTTTGRLQWGPTLFRGLLVAHGALLVAAGVTVFRQRRSPAPRLAVSEGRRGSAGVWVLLGGLSVVALALRVWRLNSGLWFDEVLTLVDFVRAPLGQIVTKFDSQNQHMLFSIFAHVAIAGLGESAWVLRLPSVLFGVASLWALFLLGRCVLDAREALLTCVLMTVSYHHVWFSQNARGYMGLMFFATLATWLWIEGVSHAAWRWWIAYAIAVALGMWTHLTMIFVPAAHALLYSTRVLGRAAGRWRAAGGFWRPVLAWLLAGSLTLQLYALALPEFVRTALHEVSLESEWTQPLWVIIESLQSLRVGFGAGVVVAAGALVAAAGCVSLLRRDWLAALAMLLPPLLGGATMVGLGHNLWPRFFFFSMGFALLIVVHGAFALPRALSSVFPLRPSPADRVGVALAGLMIAASVLSLPRCYALPKQDFTGARDFVEQARGPDDAIVAVGLAGFAYQRYFAPHWEVAETAAQLEAVRRSHSRVWVVYTLPIQLKAYRSEVWDAVQRDYEVVKVFPGTLGGGEVTVCRGRGSDAQ